MATRLRRAAFLGDVAALAALPPWREPLDGGGDAQGGLLAGVGPDLHWFDLPSGALRVAAPLFQGVRVHGLHVASSGGGGAHGVLHVAAHGGRRVALLRLRRRAAGGGAVERVCELPVCAAWVLDVRALREEHDDAADTCSDGDAPPSLLAVALSDNAVELWCVATLTRRWRSACAARALLYSAALLGDTPSALRLAAGTILNDVLLWRPQPPCGGDCGAGVPPAARLAGHEGSIHRVAWSSCGTLLASASDDRTARVWAVPAGAWAAPAPGAPPLALAPLASLYGHGGRVWDARFVEGSSPALSVLATAGEDCSVRLWRLPDGAPLAALQGHRGRGIWRCCAAPGGALATGGADGGVKLWRLADWLAGGGTEALTLHEPGRYAADCDAQLLHDDDDEEREADSDVEFARCVAAATPELLLVGTSRGVVRAAALPRAEPPRWLPPLHVSASGAPFLCVRVAPPEARAPPGVLARALLGDAAGGALLLDVMADEQPGEYRGVAVAQWTAHGGGRTLSAFWLHAAGGEALPATADGAGALTLWRPHAFDATPQRVAGVRLAQRVVSVASVPQPPGHAAVLLCGGQRGGLTLLGLHRDACGDELRMLAAAPRAHAASLVTLAQRSASGQLVTAGADGYLCTYSADADADAPAAALVRTARTHLAAISAVEALREDDEDADGDVASTSVAAGMNAGDMVLWDVRSACELLRLPCGGRRRPRAYLLGPGGRFLVAFVRHGVLHARRRWPEASAAPAADGLHALRSLHAGHHGREVHTALFVPPPDDAPAGAACALITAAEDGTIFRVFFAAPDDVAACSPQPRLRGSALLAKAAGGTAVRVLCLVRHPGGGWLLLSAGAKEVLMCWRLTWQSCDSAAGAPQLRAALLAVRAAPPEASHHAWRAAAAAPADSTGGDQRYMALAACVAGDRLLAAVASSDAALHVWALTLAALAPCWGLVASLQAGGCPLLALSCIATAHGVWLLGGATDGTVTVWALGDVLATGWPPEQQLEPAAVLRGVHQSGVNSVSVAAAPAALARASGCAPQHACLLLTGGDDQAVAAIVLELAPAGVRVAAAARNAGAHASGVKSVWTDGVSALSVALDQRLHAWRVDAAQSNAAEAAASQLDALWLSRAPSAEPPNARGTIDMLAWWRAGVRPRLRLVRCATCLSEVQDVEALAALPLGSGRAVAVAGRGTQVFSWSHE